MNIVNLIFLSANIINVYAVRLRTLGVGSQYITEKMEKYTEENPTLRSAVVKNIQQPVDHFDSQENRTWQMRYFEDLEHWKPNGPIYVYINGPGLAPDIYEPLYIYDIKKETEGALFATEHRYYGKSTPLDPSVVENLKYLSSEQALADVANLIKAIKSKPEFKQSKVAVVGGFYAGNLAAWMRLKYPELVDAAWASSAPLLAKKNFYEFYEKIGEDIKIYGRKGCYDKIVQIFRRYDKLLESPEGIKQLKNELNICDDCDITKPLNKALFFARHLYDYSYLQLDLDHVKVICSAITNSSLINFEEREAVVQPTNLNNCFECEFTNSTFYRDERHWYYQTCTEFGHYESTESDNQPFTKTVVLEYFVQTCRRLFGDKFDEKRIDEGVAHTNKLYGGLTPNVTKVVFVHGSADPTNILGVRKNLSDEAPARVISDGILCADLLKNESENRKVLEVREFVKKMLKKWLLLS